MRKREKSCSHETAFPGFVLPPDGPPEVGGALRNGQPLRSNGGNGEKEQLAERKSRTRRNGTLKFEKIAERDLEASGLPRGDGGKRRYHTVVKRD